MQYSELAELYEKLEKTSRHLEKTFLVAKFLEKTPAGLLKDVLYLLQGRVFPHADERKIGVSIKFIVKALALASGVQAEKVDTLWKEHGDLGDVALHLLGEGKQQTLFARKLTVEKVVENIRKLADLEGEGTVQKKLALISELLTSASTLEAKYIVRTILESLRTGVADGLIRDALTWAFLPKAEGYFAKCKQCHEFTPQGEKCIACHQKLEKGKADFEEYNKMVEKVQTAYNMTTDFGEVAEIAKKEGLKGLEALGLVVGKPVKVMLYQKAENIANGFEIVGKPAAVERKLDGFRVQIHKLKDDVKLFTRRLEEVTKQFPDVAAIIKKAVKSNSCILDAEVVGVDQKGKFLPFQQISQRIKRKHEIEKMMQELPVVVEVFDILAANQESLLHLAYKERRARLKALIKETKNEIVIIEQLITDNERDVEKFYKKALSEGCEGVMMKSLDSIYQPGKRVGFGVKIKPTMENLDLVIVAAEWGEGKRTSWLSSFTLACRDGNQFVTMGKVSTGLKEKSEGASFEELTQLIKPYITGEKGREVTVKPKIVVEVAFEEIQKSPTYTSGYALRFPRVLRIRNDKPVSEINTLKEIEKFYQEQK